MTGLDMNVLVRYLVQDDAIQSTQATEIIERRLTEKSPGFISLVTIAETVLVLDRAYGLSNRDVANAVKRILQADTLVVHPVQILFTPHKNIIQR